MTYLVLIGLVLLVGVLAFYYGSRLKRLEIELRNAKDYARKQTELISVFMKVIRRDAKLEEFLDELDACDDAAEFSELLQNRLSGLASSTTGTVA